MIKNKLIKFSEQFTHRDIPLQVGLENNIYEEYILNNGGIELHSPYMNYPEYKINEPIDNMEWNLYDNK